MSLLAAGCGGSSKSNQGATNRSTTGSASSASPSGALVSTVGSAKGDVSQITWGLPYGEPPTLDPPNTAFYSSMLADSEMCDSLLREEVDGAVRPGIASSVTEPNPLTIRIVLRKGVKFWDGTTVTSQDVAYDLNQARNPATAIGALLYAIKSVTPVSRYVTVVHLSQPDSLIRTEMFSLAGMIYEKRFAERAGKAFGTSQSGIMCSGPYEFKHWKSGSSITMTANPHYWDAAWRPHAKTLVLDFTADSTTLAQALKSGEIDGSYEVPAQVIPALRKASNGRLYYGPSAEGIALEVARPGGTMASVKLRQALSMVIDRGAIAKAVYYGAATPLYAAYNPTSFPADPAAHAIYQKAYNSYAAAGQSYGTSAATAKAKALVKASGYSGQPIKLDVEAGDVTVSEIAQLIQQQAAQIGMKINIVQLPPIQFTQATYDAKARGNADLLLASGFNVAKDPLEPLPFDLLPGAAYNYTDYNNSQVTALLKKAARETTPVAEARDIVKAQAIFEPSLAEIPIVDVDEISFLNNRLSGLTTNFSYMWDPTLALVGSSGS